MKLWKFISAEPGASFEEAHLIQMTVFQQSNVSLWGSPLVACLLAYLLRNTPSFGTVVAWLDVMLAVSGIRYWLHRKCEAGAASSNAIEQVRKWWMYFDAGVLLSGVLWGTAGGLFFFREEGHAQLAVGLAIAGVSSAAVAAYSPSLRTFFLFYVPMISPLMVRLVISGEPQSLTLATLCALYSTILSLVGRRLSRQTRESLSLSIANKTLLETLQEKNSALEEINDNLLDLQLDIAKSAKEKSEFLATMAHEIRTPLNGVIGLTELLSGEELPPEPARWVGSLRHCGETLLALINDILDFSRIEADRLKLERKPFDLRRCIHETIEVLQLKAREKGIDLLSEVSTEVPTVIEGDLVRIRQIVLNLVSNAVKFTEKGGVSLTVTARKTQGETILIEFSVQDSGIGIAPEDLKRLFQKYSQVDSSTTRRFGGTGLGLAICFGLVQKMNGSIGVESQIGKGSRFSFTFPTRSLEGQVPVNEPSTERGPDQSFARRFPRSILVVDDNSLNREIALKLLERIGYTGDTAGDGVAALEKAQAKNYDLILMDVSMPRMDGMESTRLIRHALPKDRQPYIAALTGHATQEERARGIEAGMDNYLCKPVRLSDLITLISNSGTGGETGDIGENPEATLPDLPVKRVQSPGPDDSPANVERLDRGVLLRLRSLTGQGEPDFLNQVIDDFVPISGEILGQLRESVNAGNPELITRYAHKLQGCARNIGALQLASVCRALEELGASRVVTGSTELMEAIDRELITVVTKLKEDWRLAA